MEAVGQLAGGVAHDFNNLLTAIIGNAELLLRTIDLEDRRRLDVLEINRAAHRAATLTRQLLAFSRKQVLQPRIVDLNGVVAELTAMLRRIIGEHVELRLQLEPGLGRVLADPGQLEQVIINLAVNARDAMPSGGTLTIRTANVDAADVPLPSPESSPLLGPLVELSVSDDGVGMDERTQARLFEPFFTTKELGRGTGLGLATVYGIVRQSGGHIRVSTRLHHGSTFTIYLPRGGGSARAGAGGGAVGPTCRRGAGRFSSSRTRTRSAISRAECSAATATACSRPAIRPPRSGSCGTQGKPDRPPPDRHRDAGDERTRAGRAAGRGAAGSEGPLHHGLRGRGDRAARRPAGRRRAAGEAVHRAAARRSRAPGAPATRRPRC